jgi:ribokinase
MNILNLGSLNIDYIYRVPHFVQPGETLKSLSFNTIAGGKGNNQSIALARAGAQVLHCGRIGPHSEFLYDLLRHENVDVSQIQLTETPTGHAIIQVNNDGENSIILYPGANHTFTEKDLCDVFENFDSKTLFLTQNETNLVGSAIQHALEKEMLVFFNPAPFTPEVLDFPLHDIHCLVVNFTEGQQITKKSSPEEIYAALKTLYPKTNLLLTLGKEGVWCYWDGKDYRQPIIPTKAIDTTAAGDTFIGYFIASLYHHQLSVAESLNKACQAASLCVSRPGASASIPLWDECK